MNPKKKAKCRQLNRNLRNAMLALQSSQNKVNELDSEVRGLNNYIQSLEDERRVLMASAAIDVTGFGKRKGFPSAVVGVGKDTADLLSINNKIQEKTSTLSMKIDLQNRQQEFVKDKEQALKHIESRISQMGCR